MLSMLHMWTSVTGQCGFHLRIPDSECGGFEWERCVSELRIICGASNFNDCGDNVLYPCSDPFSKTHMCAPTPPCTHRRDHSVCLLLPKFGRGRICVRHIPVHASARLPRPHYHYFDNLQWPAPSAAGCLPIEVSDDGPNASCECCNSTAFASLLDAATQTFLGCPLRFRRSTSIRAVKTITSSCLSYGPRSVGSILFA